MQSLDTDFNALLDRLKDRDTLNPARSDPLFYFIYPPDRMLEVKKSLTRWISRIKGNDFEVARHSLNEMMWAVVDESGRWDTWLGLEAEAEQEDLNESVRDVLRQGDALVNKVLEVIDEAPKRAVVLLTDTELLHPFFRVRIIESLLHDKVKVPTVIFYPGGRYGQYGLRFLNFYPLDGNYRSTLVGGL